MEKSGMANVSSTVSIMTVGADEMTQYNACWANMRTWVWFFSTM